MTPLKCKIVETVESTCCSTEPHHTSHSPVLLWRYALCTQTHVHVQQEHNKLELKISSRSSHRQHRNFKIHSLAECSLLQADSVIRLSEI